jgi:hypothetical protein
MCIVWEPLSFFDQTWVKDLAYDTNILTAMVLYVDWMDM